MIVRARVSSWTLALSTVALLACSRGGSARATAPAQASEAQQTGSGSNNATPSTATPSAAMPAPQAPGASPIAPRTPSDTESPSGGGGQGEPRSGTANPFDEHGGVAANAGGSADCQRDDECLCGIDRSTGACALGPASRVDSARQCPDFCGGIAGQLRVVCDHGRCTQR